MTSGETQAASLLSARAGRRWPKADTKSAVADFGQRMRGQTTGVHASRSSPHPALSPLARGEGSPRFAAFESGEDRFENVIQAFVDLDIVHANDAISLQIHHGVPPRIVRAFCVRGMRRAVDFDHELFFTTAEVREIVTYRFLPHEFEPVQPAIAQTRPEFRFGGWSVGAQGARTFRLLDTRAAQEIAPS